MSLKFKVDENMPAEAAVLLTQAGHDALTVPEQRLSGWPDSDLAAICRQENRVILTLDLNFCDIRAYPPGGYPGIIVLRLARVDKRRLLAALGRLVPLLEQETLTGKLWIVDEATVRIRD